MLPRKYRTRGYEQGTLGFPISDHACFPDDGGCRQHFDGQTFDASIYWTSATGAHTVEGRIRAKWSSIGWQDSTLRYPVTDEATVASGEGKSQRFQNGAVFYEHGTTQAFFSTGPILAKYQFERYDQGPLGWPVTDYACGLQPGNACRQHFDGSGDSVVYWTSGTGAHMVTGTIRDFYASTGWQNSHPNPDSSTIAGYPTTDQYRNPGQVNDLQRFQGGTISLYQGQACWGVPNSDVCYPLR